MDFTIYQTSSAAIYSGKVKAFKLHKIWNLIGKDKLTSIKSKMALLRLNFYYLMVRVCNAANNYSRKLYIQRLHYVSNIG